MSIRIKSILALPMLALVAACGANTATNETEEFVVIEQPPVVAISVEPTFSGKYR